MICIDKYVSKEKIKAKIMELSYEQEDGKNIYENRCKIEILKDLLGG